ncbi:dsRBD fold-containing protein [Amycolatopsis sp. NPDC058340]|uniref:dsRBD fold-containing protein n=1 Tax=Amycolatopsis sp. NPDC058340 TaxID=3346453 RepID=UPI0036606414
MTGTEPTMTDNWTIDVSLQHEPYRVRAEALLRLEDGGEFVGVGIAEAGLRNGPASQIGSYLAVTRALSDLTAELLETVASDVARSIEVDGVLAAQSTN